MENRGSEPVGEVLVAFPERQGVKLAYLSAKGSKAVKQVKEEGVALYAVSLAKAVGKGEAASLEVVAVLTHALRPFPQTRTQRERQLVVFEDSA